MVFFLLFSWFSAAYASLHSPIQKFDDVYCENLEAFRIKICEQLIKPGMRAKLQSRIKRRRYSFPVLLEQQEQWIYLHHLAKKLEKSIELNLADQRAADSTKIAKTLKNMLWRESMKKPKFNPAKKESLQDDCVLF